MDRILILLLTIITLQACISQSGSNYASNDTEYNLDNLAKDWRAQFRKNPHNIYEEYHSRIETD